MGVPQSASVSDARKELQIGNVIFQRTVNAGTFQVVSATSKSATVRSLGRISTSRVPKAPRNFALMEHISDGRSATLDFSWTAVPAIEGNFGKFLLSFFILLYSTSLFLSASFYFLNGSTEYFEVVGRGGEIDTLPINDGRKTMPSVKIPISQEGRLNGVMPRVLLDQSIYGGKTMYFSVTAYTYDNMGTLIQGPYSNVVTVDIAPVSATKTCDASGAICEFGNGTPANIRHEEL